MKTTLKREIMKMSFMVNGINSYIGPICLVNDEVQNTSLLDIKWLTIYI